LETIGKGIKTLASFGIMLALFSMIAVADVELDVPIFNQGDATWKTDKLGGCSGDTIGSDGCAITSIAMSFKYYGIDTNPRDLNNWLVNNSGYNSKKGCLVKWQKAPGRTNGIVQWMNYPYSATLNEIKSELDNGYPVIAEIKVSKGQHFVVLTGYSGSDFYMNDPDGGIQSTVNNVYGDPAKYIKGIRLYHGPTVRIIENAVYCENKDCTTATVKPGDNLTFVYNVSDPYAYNVSDVRLGAQIRLNGSTGAWIDDISNGYANDKIVNVTPGAHDYSRNFTIPAGTPDGIYDARWVIMNDTTKNWIDSREMWNIVQIKAQTGPVYNVNKSKNYNGIQLAIDDADPGNIINVASGSYQENVDANKNNLILKGIDEGTGKPIVNAIGTESAIIISADGVTLENFNAHSDYYAGISVNSNNDIIRNNNVSNQRIGIILNSSYSIVEKNIVNDNMDAKNSGIIILGSHNLIRNNSASNNTVGIYACSCLFHGNYYAISINNTIEDNIASKNYVSGIVLDNSSYNKVIHNTMDSNNLAGIVLDHLSNNNEMKENNVSKNNFGILAGISDNNLIYHNNFVNNVENANETGTNLWDDGYPSGGNYWDDYMGIDADNDGMGDTPYSIPGGTSIDRYPLIKPFSS